MGSHVLIKRLACYKWLRHLRLTCQPLSSPHSALGYVSPSARDKQRCLHRKNCGPQLAPHVPYKHKLLGSTGFGCSRLNDNICQQYAFTTGSMLRMAIKDAKGREEEGRKKDQEFRDNFYLAESSIVTVPNLLTLSRVLASTTLPLFIMTGDLQSALYIFIYAGVTDWLDGYIARKYPSQRTVFGTVFDPIADKILLIISSVSLGVVGLIPGPLAGVIIGKDVVMLAAGAVLRFQTVDKPVTLKKYFDLKTQTMEMKPLQISKINTFLQISTLVASLAAPVFGFVGNPILPILWWSTGLTTIATAASYLAAKDAYEIKKPPKK